MHISEVKGIGDKAAGLYRRLGITTVDDLLFHLPKSYVDFSNLSPLDKVQPGAFAAVAEIEVTSSRYTKNRRHLCEAVARDGSGAVKLVWFNQPYRAKSLKAGHKYLIMGELDFSYGSYQVINPDIELFAEEKQARILANYPLTKGLSSKAVRRHIASAIAEGLHRKVEKLPEVVSSHVPLDMHQAIKAIHLPESMNQAEQAKKTLKFWELFALTLASEQLRSENLKEQHYKIPFNEQLTKKFVADLDFELTPDQRRAAWQIIQDMASEGGMNRLLNGDVGSGKTAVAELVSFNVIDAGKQVAFVAPTTILAQQHYNDLKARFAKIALLTSALTVKQKQELKQKIAERGIDIVVGTHALFQEDVSFKDLALIIVDEQHRFGVEQRRTLLSKEEVRPHMLTMTATPIPRSLALTLYGDLDVSQLRTMPKGRLPVETEIQSSHSRAPVMATIRQDLQKRHQVYVVCPSIEESEDEPMMSVEKASQIYGKEFKDKKIAVLHSKLKQEQKDAIMQQFVDKKIDILISTTVIEVGVNVPNANLMIIEDAERFGLAQLHQLRGRVGRAKTQARCLLLTAMRPIPARLRAMTTTNNGFDLAELDLKLRGPGAIYGKSQSGQLDLRIATLDDLSDISDARAAAKSFMKSDAKLVQYPQLKNRVQRFKEINYLN